MKKTGKIKLVRLRGKNQITLPESVINALELEEGDYLAAVTGEDGTVSLRPARLDVAGTPGAEKAIQRAKGDIAAGRTEQFDSIQDFTSDMLSKHREQMKEGEAERTWMLVHVGTTLTSVSIQRLGAPILTRAIAIGSGGTVQQLAEEVKKTVEFFRAAGGGSEVGKVFLSAGQAQMAGLAEELKRALGTEVSELPSMDVAAPQAYVVTGFEEAGLYGTINAENFLFNARNLMTRK